MNGILIINKEKDYTSNDIVQIIKKIFKEKVGHTGTLDPMATGVLPILIGKGTLLSKYLINHDKIYTATVRLGIKTDTGDITGNRLLQENVNDNCFEEQKIQKVLNEIKGEQKQIPPMYSAIKINGKKLYEYARKGLTVNLEARLINIYDANLIDISKNTNEITFRVKCSKGTYIRTLCEKIAGKLGTIGTMSALNREMSGEFDISKSVLINQVKENFQKQDFISQNLISIEKFFADKECIYLSPRSFIAFINGVKLFSDEIDGVYKIYDIKQNFIGTGIVNKGILKRDIVI